jgi:uncharacterized membrane protein
MSYIGQTLPTDTFGGFTRLINLQVTAQCNTTFTFSQNSLSTNQGINWLSIDGVIQEPTTDDFTVSGTTLTISRHSGTK